MLYERSEVAKVTASSKTNSKIDDEVRTSRCRTCSLVLGKMVFGGLKASHEYPGVVISLSSGTMWGHLSYLPLCEGS